MTLSTVYYCSCCCTLWCTNQLPGERNYHIFYQLCSGASAALKQELAIEGGADSFYLLTGGDCTAIAGVDDVAAFSSLQVRYEHFASTAW
jgi:myosin heavy subunit